jgi:hypothetical protein
MPYREIEDEDGVWMVFSTEPRSGANVRPQYAMGWLSFQRGPERRRLSPIPTDWEHADDDQIRLWLHHAAPVEKTDDDWMAGDPLESIGARPRAEPAAVVHRSPAPALDRDEVDAADALPPPSSSARAAKPASHSLVSQSIERIRALLSDIRSHDK